MGRTTSSRFTRKASAASWSSDDGRRTMAATTEGSPRTQVERHLAGEQIRLLVIEDVPQVASHMRSLLNAQTQIKMLDVVTSGEKAAPSVAEMRPDIVIVDALLQGRVSGTHVAEAIR